MVALTISGKIYKRHFDGSINAEKLLVGLEHIRRHEKAMHSNLGSLTNAPI